MSTVLFSVLWNQKKKEKWTLIYQSETVLEPNKEYAGGAIPSALKTAVHIKSMNNTNGDYC